MESSHRISRLANGLYRTTGALAILLPAVVLIDMAQVWRSPAALLARFPQLPGGLPITPAQGAWAAALGLIALMPLMLAFVAMRRLFGRYRTGEILSDGCAADILRIGQALFALAAASVILPTAQMLALSWNAPPGARILAIGIDGNTMGFLLSGGLLITIGWVMREASRSHAEMAADLQSIV